MHGVVHCANSLVYSAVAEDPLLRPQVRAAGDENDLGLRTWACSSAGLQKVSERKIASSPAVPGMIKDGPTAQSPIVKDSKQKKWML